MAKNRVIPFGYCMRNGEITVDFKESKAVVKIFEEYAVFFIALTAGNMNTTPLLLRVSRTSRFTRCNSLLTNRKLMLDYAYVKEISAPKGYALSTKVYELKANQTVTVYEDFQTGKIKINKTAEDKLVRDVEFKVVGSDGSSYTKKTNALGIAEFSGLKVYDMKTGKAITYTVSEINVATRYETPKAKNVVLTSGTADLTVNVNFNNELKTGSIKINKQSEDGENGDRSFEIKGGGKTYTIKTGSDGIAILSDIPVYDKNNVKIAYTISEKNVPIKYVVPADHKVSLTADATTNITFKNVLKKFTAGVVKKDYETSVSQGDATLAGAVYGLYLDGKLIDEYTTDENGYFKTK